MQQQIQRCRKEMLSGHLTYITHFLSAMLACLQWAHILILNLFFNWHCPSAVFWLSTFAIWCKTRYLGRLFCRRLASSDPETPVSNAIFPCLLRIFQMDPEGLCRGVTNGLAVVNDDERLDASPVIRGEWSVATTLPFLNVLRSDWAKHLILDHWIVVIEFASYPYYMWSLVRTQLL